MHDRTTRPRPLVAVLVLIAMPAWAAAQEVTRSGTLTAVWGDPPPASTAPPVLQWYLTDDRGRAVEVAIPSDVLRRAGGVLALDRQRVQARGVLDRRPGISPVAPPVLRAGSVVAEGPAAGADAHPPAQLGSRPYAVLLCRFADVATEPQPPSFFNTLMGDGYPNMGHYFHAISGGRMDLGGTTVFGWHPLPRPRADYFDEGAETLSLYRIADDCIAAAGPVDFSPFAGIILQFNAQFSATGLGYAYGGSRLLGLGGGDRVWPLVWMPAWAMADSRYGIYAHEIGHSMGLPHSAGPYGRMYDSLWDVMSRPYLRFESALGAWVPGGTIAFHKDLLGWIPDGRKVRVTDVEDLVVVLAPHGSDPDGADPVLLEIGIPGRADFYTVEARRRTGYDQALPGEAVIMHRVPALNGPHCTLYRCAIVVDPSGNGNPNDTGAMWRPGETFDDGLVRLTVTEEAGNGWMLRVSVAVPQRPAGLTVSRAAAALLDGIELSSDEVEYLDLMGNRNGRYDLGDFLSFADGQFQP
jgi:hypothetical protein